MGNYASNMDYMEEQVCLVYVYIFLTIVLINLQHVFIPSFNNMIE